MNILKTKSEPSHVFFPKAELDIPALKVFPLDLANTFRAKSSRRNSIEECSHLVVAVSTIALALNVIVSFSLKEEFLSGSTFQLASISIGLISALGIAWFTYVANSFYDFHECDDYAYKKIAELKKTDSALVKYTEAIKDSGRDWISNYEWRAMRDYLQEKELENERIQLAANLESARAKAFE